MTLTFIHIPRTGGRSVCSAFGWPQRHEPKPAGRTFAIIRNPFDHALAWWLSTTPYGRPEDFQEWVRTDMERTEFNGTNPLAQADWINPDTWLFLFPHIQSAVAWAASQLWVPVPEVPHKGKGETPKRDWRDWYDRGSLEIVRDARHKELALEARFIFAKEIAK